MTFSLLSITRIAIFKEAPIMTTVTSDYAGSIERGFFPKNVLFSFVREIKMLSRTDVNLDWKKPVFEEYHSSFKSSPLADIAIDGIMIELAALPLDLLSSITTVGGVELKNRIEFLFSNFRIITENIPLYTKSVESVYLNLIKKGVNLPKPIDIHDYKDAFFTSLQPYIRKHVIFSEPELKTRIIGLADYFSQTALRSLGTVLFEVLKTIPHDRTFDQTLGLSELSFNSGADYYSLDISAFTDRFPQFINELLLTELFGDISYSAAITHILCGNPYWNPKTNTFSSYRCGCPMGVRAGWPLTTLSHHLTIFYACYNLEID